MSIQDLRWAWSFVLCLGILGTTMAQQKQEAAGGSKANAVIDSTKDALPGPELRKLEALRNAEQMYRLAQQQQLERMREVELLYQRALEEREQLLHKKQFQDARLLKHKLKDETRMSLERAEQEAQAVQEREAKLFELERQCEELSESCRRAGSEASRKTARLNLERAITQLFDLREQNRQQEVLRMEAEVQRLKETLTQRQQYRLEIIQRRLEQLTGEASNLHWE